MSRRLVRFDIDGTLFSAGRVSALDGPIPELEAAGVRKESIHRRPGREERPG